MLNYDQQHPARATATIQAEQSIGFCCTVPCVDGLLAPDQYQAVSQGQIRSTALFRAGRHE